MQLPQQLPIAGAPSLALSTASATSGPSVHEVVSAAMTARRKPTPLLGALSSATCLLQGAASSA
jgi:hypothetical protein